MNRFDVAYLPLFAAMLPGIAWKRMRHGKYRESLPAMLGRRLPSPSLAPAEAMRCWMHSVSVGETIAAGSVFRELRRRRPEWEVLCSTTTETGQAQARRTMQGAAHFTYAPIDFSWVVRRYLDAWRPDLYLFFETEIWPNLLGELGRRKTPVYLVNGKLSERSARRYARLKGLFRPPLANVRRFFMQTEQDAGRLALVLGSSDRIEVAGNVKFDALPEPLSMAERAAFRRKWGADDGTVVVLAGSTHPGEEEVIWDAWSAARRAGSRGLLVIAPRHPERFGAVAEMLAGRGLRVHRTSRGDNPAGSADTDAVVFDEMGLLARSFGACEIALLGGSWVPVGGHNLLEPACHGVPVLRGPHMQAQPDIVRVLGPGNGALEVLAERLADAIGALAADAGERTRLGALAAAAANSNRGAAGRVVDGLLRDLERPRD